MSKDKYNNADRIGHTDERAKINIIMATYNGEKYISDQIESILSNTFIDWVLTIYDDGSKDNTVSMAKEYEKKYPEKIVVFQNEKNLGAMNNFFKGITLSKEKYIMFCDQDDVWKKDKIQVTYDKMLEMEQSKEENIPIAIFTDASIVDEKLNIIHHSFFKAGSLDVNKIDLPHILIENKLIGCTVMINEELSKRMNNLPKDARMHDWWIAILAATFGKIEFINQPTVLYRQHGNNVIGGNKNYISYFKNRIMALQKQKQALLTTQRQAECFYQIYRKQLQEPNKKIIFEFAHLHEKNWLKRRYLVVRYRYCKTGFIRNIGVFLLI